MGRRGSRMGLRGKPALILIAIVGLLVTFGLYYSRSSSYKTMDTHDHHHHHDRINLGDFDANKFMRDINPRRDPELGNELKQRNLPGLKETEIHDTAAKGNKVNAFENFDFKDGHDNLDRSQVDEDDDDDQNHVNLDKNMHDLDRNPDNVHKNEDDEILQESNKPEPKTLSGQLHRLYRKPNPRLTDTFHNMKHIVHLDLKGAAPKLDYLENLLPLLSSLGATGLLVEYEDMFPYVGDLSLIAAKNSYTKSDMIQFFNLAKKNKLEIIPLVQTFGHLEFVLKHEKYMNLREDSETPQVITPLVNDTYTLLGAMIDQIMTVHAESQFLHIGCDEVYHLGEGKSAPILAQKGYTKEDLFFEHVSRVVRYVKEKYPKVTLIIWDDQLRDASTDNIKKFGLGGILEPMIWAYTPNPGDKFTADMWEKYEQAFSHMWAASSFKGATGSAQYYTDVTYHLRNHYGWIDIITKVHSNAPNLKFRGVALTGWQRYDHFSTLCELIPAAIPSLSVCLLTISNGGFTESEYNMVQHRLSCDEDMVQCGFPGSDVYSLMQELRTFENETKNDEGLNSRLNGWLTDYNVKHGFGSPGQLKVLVKTIDEVMHNYKELHDKFLSVLAKYYYESTLDEWIDVHIDQKIRYYYNKANAANSLMSRRVWPRRPLVSFNDVVTQNPQHQVLDNNDPLIQNLKFNSTYTSELAKINGYVQKQFARKQNHAKQFLPSFGSEQRDQNKYPKQQFAQKQNPEKIFNPRNVRIQANQNPGRGQGSAIESQRSFDKGPILPNRIQKPLIEREKLSSFDGQERKKQSMYDSKKNDGDAFDPNRVGPHKNFPDIKNVGEVPDSNGVNPHKNLNNQYMKNVPVSNGVIPLQDNPDIKNLGNVPDSNGFKPRKNLILNHVDDLNNRDIENVARNPENVETENKERVVNDGVLSKYINRFHNDNVNNQRIDQHQ
ncbi:uncharacterized protein LOC126816152 [Patella vulgata]|uniref:uncharacterized protein LOC126816152 n=1 Tax=Patella vulgata TaxID=6465 RepID=UPI00217F3FCA|nr:uncharacterized protein LOC126816152 [Patella vulgata]XP_050398341.1 uncharacterized protein LOC126816152 [Patella vulgata]XP_050398342.1 uncharacterized protein LOC126816152 [Patella vulgata]